jgi:hypothetical protein
MNVAQYFREKVDAQFDDPNGDFASIPLDSPCGEDCKSAIDAASSMIIHLGDVFGKQAEPRIEQIQEITEDLVGCYICG